ncbi:er-golgi snare complex subunit [Grosmannia clavigera kw1407]|uniref:Er-golgi snare complex subunit n=1 Tax=Grosmannia clavigera (strain kw1407 / UAMH 11150) TaxID=655863 RepID=F0XBT5_GROCL|nr:er-golgi snare complex subunit [Grosmannia clavigera kw1407]EFX04882.1 er-golgi snare complex subunit [Grosmannia clavigera kw1407]
MAVSRIQDRTVEFRTVVQQAQRRHVQSSKGAATAQKKRAMMFAGGGASVSQQQQQPLLAPGAYNDGTLADEQSGAAAGHVRRSEFARRAAEIGRGISATMAKLERLAMLAKRKSMFDDKATEVNELTFVVKQNLASINQQISGLQALSRQQQGGKSEEGEHRKNVVYLLQDRLTGVSASFKEVLEVRTKNLQSTRARTDNFISQVAPPVQQHGAGGGSLHQQSASPLYAAATTGSSSGSGRNTPALRGGPAAASGLLLDGGSGGGDLLSLNPVVSDQQLMMMEEAQPSNTYIQQRGDAIEAIESTIAELGSIFGQLASMVSEQSEMIERIDANTESVVDNVQGAQKELLKYWGRVSGNRWLIAKMFGVLMIFFLLWVLIAG